MRTETRVEPRTCTRAPCVDVGRRWFLGRGDPLVVQAPVRPVGEVTSPAHAVSPSAQPSPPARWRRYQGDSHAAGQWPRLAENTRPPPPPKPHATGYPTDRQPAPGPASAS